MTQSWDYCREPERFHPSQLPKFTQPQQKRARVHSLFLFFFLFLAECLSKDRSPIEPPSARIQSSCHPLLEDKGLIYRVLIAKCLTPMRLEFTSLPTERRCNTRSTVENRSVSTRAKSQNLTMPRKIGPAYITGLFLSSVSLSEDRTSTETPSARRQWSCLVLSRAWNRLRFN